MVLGYYNGRLRIAVHDVPRARRSEPPRRESLQLSLLHLSYTHSMSQPKLSVSLSPPPLALLLTSFLEHYVPLLMSTSSTVRLPRVSQARNRPDVHVLQVTLAFLQEQTVRRLQSKA